MYKDEIEKARTLLSDSVCRSIIGEVDMTAESLRIFSFALQHAKERLKPVDLSVLIESGIDCEFAEEEKEWVPGKLHTTRTISPKYGETYTDVWYTYCRPRINHVHAWQGGSCPLPEGLEAKVYTRNGIDNFRETYATDYWGHRDNADRKWDIIGFEVFGLADGYCWPWEQGE